MAEFKWFLFIILIMGVVWFLGGGPERASSRDPFIHPPNPVGQGGTYSTKGFWNVFRTPFTGSNDPYEVGFSATDGYNDYIQDGEEILYTDLPLEVVEYKKAIELYASYASATDASSEYITISISPRAQNAIIFDGWTLRSNVTGNSVSIAKASYLPRMGAINEEQTIKAYPGDTIIVTTGKSPIGTSFRINKCTGYLSQFQSFSPRLPKQCPRPEDEIPKEYNSGPNAFNDGCLDFIENIGICRINTNPLPLNMQSQCQDFVTRKLNYNACISDHSNEPDFYGDEWRVYLKRDAELWKSRREIIELVDPSGNVVQSVSY